MKISASTGLNLVIALALLPAATPLLADETKAISAEIININEFNIEPKSWYIEYKPVGKKIIGSENPFTLYINNNSPAGYTIYAESLNGALINQHDRTKHPIKYKLVCEPYQTISFGSDKQNNSSNNINLKADSKHVIYDIIAPKKATAANSKCYIELLHSDFINIPPRNQYIDTITFSSITW